MTDAFLWAFAVVSVSAAWFIGMIWIFQHTAPAAGAAILAVQFVGVLAGIRFWGDRP